MSIDVQIWQVLLREMHLHVQSHTVPPDSNDLRVSEMLVLDPSTGRFTGSNADTANQWMRREYRRGFEVPELGSI